MDERALVEKILAKDEPAFKLFYDMHKVRLSQTAAHFLGSGAPDIPDVVQETFLAALPKLDEFRFESSLYTWLNRFTVNFCFQAINKRKKRVLSETEQLEKMIKPVLDNAPVEVKKILMDEIEALSAEHKEVLMLRHVEGKSYSEIAEQLQLAPGTVMSRISKARDELKKKIEIKKAMFSPFWTQS